MKSLHPSPPLDQSETDLGIVNESQLLRFGINWKLEVGQSQSLPRLRTQKQKGHIIVLRNAMLRHRGHGLDRFVLTAKEAEYAGHKNVLSFSQSCYDFVRPHLANWRRDDGL